MVGDTHGNPHWVEKVVVPVANENEVDLIFQLGDFGFNFDPFFTGQWVKANMPVYWIDGNHDNHEYLIRESAFYANEFVEIWKNVFYVPRGFMWQWDGVNFLGLGGAYSVDKHRRVLGMSYWEQEMITAKQVVTASSYGPDAIDVILTHDAPMGIPLATLLGGKEAFPIADADKSRASVRLVYDALEPVIGFHGHYHMRHTSRLLANDYASTVIGLNCDDTISSLAIFDTETFEVFSAKWQFESQYQPGKIIFERDEINELYLEAY